MLIHFKPTSSAPGIRIGEVLCNKEGEYDLPECVLTDYPSLFTLGDPDPDPDPDASKSVHAPERNRLGRRPDRDK